MDKLIHEWVWFTATIFKTSFKQELELFLHGQLKNLHYVITVLLPFLYVLLRYLYVARIHIIYDYHLAVKRYMKLHLKLITPLNFVLWLIFRKSSFIN